ncbi:hypothetical protein [Phenylobacterium hankyongense]|nr:hypothetical protein [Phenylobacterium hankyongense]
MSWVSQTPVAAFFAGGGTTPHGLLRRAGDKHVHRFERTMWNPVFG